MNSTLEKNRSRKNSDKVGKVLYKLTNNAVYGKTMQNVWNSIDVKLVSNKKGLSKINIQAKLYVTPNIWQWFSHDA